MDGGGHGRVAAIDEAVEPTLQEAPLEEHVPSAALTAEADVSPEPVDPPVAAAAWMGASESDDVAEQQLDDRSVGHGPGAYQRRGWASVGLRLRVVAGTSIVSPGVTTTVAWG